MLSLAALAAAVSAPKKRQAGLLKTLDSARLARAARQQERAASADACAPAV